MASNNDNNSSSGDSGFICPACEKHVDPGIKFCPSCGTPIVHAMGNDDWVGRIVAGKYRVEELVGEGGMGQVFRATQLSLDKSVVLKVLRKSLLSDARTVARFQREAKAASRLNHPNAIGIIDFGQDNDDTLYIAMEYVAGRDLHQILTEEGPIPERRLIKIGLQILGALAEAHAVGVIHRDLKPENIMIEQRRDQTDFVKVLDFGIAKLQETGTGAEGQALTRAGFVCGTPEYMSPEQAQGLEIDPRSDLYAVGVILYQCLTGVLPFDADSPVALATMHMTEEPVPPREKNPKIHCSDGLEKLILRAMAKSPDDRPQNAEQFRSELIAVEKNLRTAAKREANARRRHRDQESVRADEAVSDSRDSIESFSAVSVSPVLAKSKRADTPQAHGSSLEEEGAGKSGPSTLSSGSHRSLFLAALIGLGILAVGAAVLFFGGTQKATPETEIARGDELFFQKNYREALAHYRMASSLKPSPENTKREALAHIAMGDGASLKEALQRYQMQTGGNAPDGTFVERHLENNASAKPQVPAAAQTAKVPGASSAASSGGTP